MYAWPALHALPPSAISVDDAVHVGYTTHLQPGPLADALRAAGKAALLYQLGDVVAVMRSKSLRSAWGLSALLDLLQSQQLATDSEDSVLTAVSCWADAAKPAAADARQVLEGVRLL